MGEEAKAPQDTVARAETIFAEFVRQRDAGRSLGFGALCAAHPELAGALRILNSLHGNQSLGASTAAGSELDLVVPQRVGRSRLAGPGLSGEYCIRCGRKIEDAFRCTSPECSGLPNFYRDIARRVEA